MVEEEGSHLECHMGLAVVVGMGTVVVEEVGKLHTVRMVVGLVVQEGMVVGMAGLLRSVVQAVGMAGRLQSVAMGLAEEELRNVSGVN